MSSVPVLLCGKSPMLAQSFMKALSADYDVVHVCNTLSAAQNEIPALLRGDPIAPVSGLGSNTHADAGKPRIPRAIIVGKGFSDKEVQTLRACEGLDKVPILLPNDEQMTWGRIAKITATAGTAFPNVIAERVEKCMKEHGLTPGKEGETEGGVWEF